MPRGTTSAASRFKPYIIHMYVPGEIKIHDDSEALARFARAYQMNTFYNLEFFAVNFDYVQFPRNLLLNALQTRLVYSHFGKKSLPWEADPPPSHILPSARSLRSLADDLTQMCPLRGFAPPKLKVFRRACLRGSYTSYRTLVKLIPCSLTVSRRGSSLRCQ